MHKAIRSFSADYDGERVEIEAGRTRVANDHELRRRFPDAFEYVEGSGSSERMELRGIDPEGRVRALYTEADLVEAGERAKQDQLERIRELAKNPANREPGDGNVPLHGEPARSTAVDQGPPHLREARDKGLRAIERHSDALSAPAADRLDHLARDERDRMAQASRYLDAVGDPDYHSAFGKMIVDPQNGHLRFSPAEVAAVRKVTQIQEERALITTTGSAGGFAIPFTLDPSVMLSSNGALNPVRDLARVITVSTHDWKGVSSDGVTVGYVAEATAATDASPVLAQPTISTQQWRAFIPFSIEISQDWGSLEQELLRLVSDGRDVNDATQFLTGTGTNAPQGVLTGLTTTQRVQTAGAGAIAIGDVYALKNALPPRFSTTGTFTFAPSRLDSVYRLTPAGSTTEPQALPTRDGPLLGRDVREWSTMATGSTTGTKWAIYGDFFNGYQIVDRLGITAEIIPHLFGAAQGNLPTGQRGLYVYGRTGAGVIVPNAFRYGEVL
jgi:HK97 family phage major capsid protein